jgi:hypothetical protein
MNISSLSTNYQNQSWLRTGSRFSTHRITITDRDAKWRDSAMKNLQAFVRLDRGWDGYAAVPVSLATATFALKMLEAMCNDQTDAPQIVPGPNGEVQLEWHTETGDVEILVRGPYDVTAWRQMVGADDDGEEMQLSTDFLPAAKWIQEVTEPEFAYAAAA